MLRNPGDRQLHGRYRGRRPSLRHRGTGRSYVGLRQVEGKGATSIWSAAQLDFASEQTGQLAADGEAQTCASVLAAGAGICLLESLEDDPLLIQRNANASIGNLKSDNRSRFSQNRMIFAPAAPGSGDRQAHAPEFGKLERVGQ